MACKIIYKGKALPEEEAKIEINNDVVDDLNEQAVGKSIINSALLTDEEINQQITDLNKFKTVIENNYFKLEDNISVSSLVINKHIKNAPASLGKVKIDSKWRTKEEAKKQVEENLKQRKLFSKLKRNFGITEEQLNLIENVSADKAISSAEDLINAIESKLLSLNSLVLNSKKSKSATLQQKQQAKTIEQLFNENPELANSVYEALGFNNLRKEYSNVIINQVWKRLASEGITNADSLIGTRETINNKDFNKFWSAVKDIDIQNVIKFFESEKQKALDSYSKYKGEFDSTTGTFTSNDTSFFDDKIKDLNTLLQQKQQAQQLYSQYLQQNPNGSIEQFKRWIKGDKREYKSSSASLPLRGNKKVEYKNVSEFSEAINFLSQRFGINVILNKLNDDIQLNVFGSTGPLGNYDAVNNTININKNEEIYEGVIVHEFIHGFSRLMQSYNKEAFRSLVDYHYNSLSTDTETLRSLWNIAYEYGNLETIPKTLFELPEGQNKDYIYDEIFTRLIEREYNENGSLKDFEKPSSIFYKLFEWVKKFFGIKYNREEEFSKLTTSSTVKDFYNILKKVDNLKVSKEEYIKGTNTNESIYNVYKILNNRNYQDLNSQEKEEVNRYMKEYNDYIKSLSKLSISQKSQERLNQVQEVFNENPELSSIGTPEQYSNYLNTIFPDSKVKEIYLHQTRNDFKDIGFDKDKIGSNTNNNGYYGYGFYFVKDTGIAINGGWGGFTSSPIAYGEIEMSVILNVKKTKKITNIQKDPKKLTAELKRKGYDSIDAPDGLVIFDPEQIHILGSQSDIQGFKDFVQGKQFQKLTAEEKSKTIEQVTKEHRSIAALKDLSAKLAHRIGGKVEFENNPSADWKAYNQGMKSVLNEAYMDESTAFHEIMGHPIIRALKSISSQKESVTLQQMIDNQEIEKKCS